MKKINSIPKPKSSRNIIKIKKFVSAVNTDIKKLNKLIDKYNGYSTKNDLKKQSELLEEIERFGETIKGKYKANHISACPAFAQEFQINLFNEIQTERSKVKQNISESNGKDSEPKISKHVYNLIPPLFTNGTTGKFFNKVVKKVESELDVLHGQNPDLLLDDLLGSDTEVFNKAFKAFFSTTRKDKENNYKLQIKAFLLSMVEVDDHQLRYKNLQQLKALIQTAIPEQNVSTNRAKALRQLIFAIDKKLVQLKETNPNLGNNSLHSKSNFPKILAAMEPEKVSELIKILDEGKDWKYSMIENLYQPNHHRYDQFKQFLSTHDISYLGGNNSKNFKVTEKKYGTNFVLKVDNRLDAPKNIEARLMAGKLQDNLTPILAERQATYINNKNKPVTRILLFTEFCSGGDLESHSLFQKNANTRLKFALNIYKQMAAILIAIQEEQVVFPDMKNNNWLLDDNGKLKIADTKSFLPTLKGEWNPNNKISKWFQLLSTPYMNPPEFNKPFCVFDADSVHSYQIGKNLYQYLTQQDNKYLSMNRVGAEYDFSNPIFKSEAGKGLVDLIKSTIVRDPHRRMPVKDILETLNNLDKIVEVSIDVKTTNIVPVIYTEKIENLMPPTNISMMVLGGFIAAVGITAVVIAFTVLNAATLGVAGIVVAGVGITALLLGTGLFAVGYNKSNGENRKDNQKPEDLELVW